MVGGGGRGVGGGDGKKGGGGDGRQFLEERRRDKAQRGAQVAVCPSISMSGAHQP